MGSISDVLAALRQAPTNVDRGTLFEQLMVRYFQLDPALAQQYDEVCRWIDWEGRAGKPDTGIDLVARERDTGNLTAIQCKFYEPGHLLAKSDIDSFFTASGKKPFTNRVIISTTDKWGKNAEDALGNQQIPVQRIGMADIAESPIDWDIAWPQGNLAIGLSPAERKQPRPYQVEAIEAVLGGFAVGNDRGKLIMACGTGKTFTALKIAERIAEEAGGSARVLFLVPSISLLSQSLREWTAQCELDMRAFGVCSDTKVGKLRSIEDFNVHDVPIPVTTNPAKLREEMEHRKRAKGLTVVFSTYQSLPTVADAQALGVDRFDLVVADESHRTTGVTLAGDDESNFVRIHDADYICAARRLYMTATPRIFAETVKDKAEQYSAELVSMDDEVRYGPEFHHLSFGDAVERGLLTDYKVLVLTVDESAITAPMQQQLAAEGELHLDDASKIVGCWNGLAKRAGATADGTPNFAADDPPMQRAVAFAKDIAASKQLAKMFPRVVSSYQQTLDTMEDHGHPVSDTNRGLVCDVRHVDGTYNALTRNAELAWLKAPVVEGECRILTNARCLSEGVDVPALDAVLFLHPRNSLVDVVQSVGRVMRLSPGKDYGYVILPIAVPSGVEPATALADNQRFKVVWQVLNALRSHDERFDAMINSISLNAGTKDTPGMGSQLLGAHLGPTTDNADQGATTPSQMALFSVGQWQEAIYTRIVDKVGTRVYWDQWAADVADIAAAQVTRINAILASPDTAQAVTEQFERFWKGLRDNLNDSISRDDAINMLSQHLITKPIFDALFAGHDFAAHNPVSKVMQAMTDALDGHGLDAETQRLDKFYDSVRLRAEQVVSAEGKQHLIAELYEKFFRTAFKKQSEALGIVYTPTEVVDFILRAADHACREHLGHGLTDEGVHLLDATAGTGGLLSVAEERILERNPQARLRLYGQEINDQSYAICKSDMLVKGQDPGNIRVGDTLTDDQFWDRTFDYCTSNPPFGYSWLGAREAVEKEAMVPGSRFSHGLPGVGDGAMLFLCHLVHKMRPAHEGGGRAGIVLNGSPLFTGAAESGPSKIRQWLLESDLVEAIIALPTNMFFNTGIATYIWILDNTKRPERQGKIQLIDASSFWTKLRKNLGSKSREVDAASRDRILAIYDDFEDADPDLSKVLTANDFGYWTITVERPLLDDAGNPVVDRKRTPKPDTKRRDTENVPFTYGGNVAGDAGRDATIKAYVAAEVLPHVPDAWIDEKKTKVGYEIPFTRHFYKYVPPRPLAEIDADLEKQVAKIMELLQEVEK